MPRSVRAPFPFVPASNLEFHSEAEPMWQRLLQDMANAKRRLWIENYIFDDGAAANAVLAAIESAIKNGATV